MPTLSDREHRDLLDRAAGGAETTALYASELPAVRSELEDVNRKLDELVGLLRELTEQGSWKA